MGRKITINNKVFEANFVLDKIREYENLLGEVYDRIRHSDAFALKGYSKVGFQNHEESISIPGDKELIESIIGLIRNHCEKNREIYIEALCK